VKAEKAKVDGAKVDTAWEKADLEKVKVDLDASPQLSRNSSQNRQKKSLLKSPKKSRKKLPKLQRKKLRKKQ